MPQVILGPLYVICPAGGRVIFRAYNGRVVTLDVMRIREVLYVRNGVDEYYIRYDADDAEEYRGFTALDVPKGARLVSFDPFELYSVFLVKCGVGGLVGLKRRAWFVLRSVVGLDCSGEFEDAVEEFEDGKYDLWRLAWYVEGNVGEYYRRPCRWLAAVAMMYIRAYDYDASAQVDCSSCLSIVRERVSEFARSRDPTVFRGIYLALMNAY
jgi:hypothetical protein